MREDVVDPERARRLPWALLSYAIVLTAFLNGGQPVEPCSVIGC